MKKNSNTKKENDIKNENNINNPKNPNKENYINKEKKIKKESTSKKDLIINKENNFKGSNIKKSNNSFKQFLQENLKSIIIMLIFIIVVNIELPYYIEAPGGTINLTERIDDDYNKKMVV